MSKKIAVNTIGLSSITNDIRAAIFNNADPLAVVQAITESAPHNDRQWVFYGLAEGVNFTFKIQQNISGVWTDVQGYSFTFTTDDSSISFKAPQLIQADVTPGITSNKNSFVFDGTSGKPDWRGWDIEIERIGTGTMKANIDYSWHPATGTFTLLQTGDVFGPDEYFNNNFIPQVGNNGGGQPLLGFQFSGTSNITSKYSIQDTDFGGMLVVKGASDYIEMVLPDINLVPENKILYIESGLGSHKCLGLKTFSGTQYIDWLTANRIALYFGICEYLEIFNQRINSTTKVWRIKNPNGNFKTVGRTFHSYTDTTEEINALYLDGGGVNGISSKAYARLYNEHVLNLASSKVCQYSDWPYGNNKYKYSYADPTTGLFRIPDTRDLFTRNTGASRDVGIFQNHAMLDHQHITQSGGINDLNGQGFGKTTQTNYVIGRFSGPSTGSRDLTSKASSNNGTILTNVDSETRPVNNSMNQFVLV